MSKIKEVCILPPLGISRFGQSPTPLDNFNLTKKDTRVRGTFKSRVVPEKSLRIKNDGSVEVHIPKDIIFKDKYGFRPVAPFFEPWFSTENDQKLRPLTEKELNECGYTLNDVIWEIHLGNAKAYHYSLKDSDYYSVRKQVPGTEHSSVELFAYSDPNSEKPLVLKSNPIYVGSIQVIKPSEEHNKLRARYSPPKGLVYGPTNLEQKYDGIKLPEERRILNPDAYFCSWNRNSLPSDNPLFGDTRHNPAFLYVQDSDETAIGVVDDMVDGIISIKIGNVHVAQARVVVGPPDFAPDRRPFVNLADGLKDKVDRIDAVTDDFYMDFDSIEEIVQDLFERIFETAYNSNLDVQNDRSLLTNNGLAARAGEESPGAAFNIPISQASDTLPLTEMGRRTHRRMSVFYIIKERVKDGNLDLRDWVREPLDSEQYYNNKMPALMRGSDRRPMHLSRRQYMILMRWQDEIREEN